ncbi:DUF2254 domain-containing protein [Robbsia sp. Bb-Pol-6]|uniref:DUF2254 domain-containing protein n=1 Tax=Robbsia betulipollinis TaxID=2981849 RepID=A0ABT3ZJG3_9BURK|nr:DUF2254 domain-containing protein [Robbsia betulipollinis]MCY0386679.1 DUF2254 domain-containing protein [Robbsia betulipollinis]
MYAKWRWIARRIFKRIWFRATLFSLLGVVSALVSVGLRQYIPDSMSTKIGADAVDNILGIIASSMLAVTTFSLSTMVSAYGSATGNATPRATSLLVEDATTQNALSAFIGSFLFSLVGIITLSTGAYGSKGRVVLFIVTIGVIILIVYTLLTWIDHLSRLGHLGETTDRVEGAAKGAIMDRARRPYMGGRAFPAGSSLPLTARPLYARKIGYVQLIDMPSLRKISDKTSGHIYVHAIPGTFAETTMPIAWVDDIDAHQEEGIIAAFVIGTRRSYEQDPRFGVSVMAEIASRALSPAVNDPGTAIDVIGRGIRVFSLLANPGDAPPKSPECARVFVRGIDLQDVFDDFFAPIARDGAGTVEVGMRLQKALAALARIDSPGFRLAAQRHSALALQRAEMALSLESDKTRLRSLQVRSQDEFGNIASWRQ